MQLSSELNELKNQWSTWAQASKTEDQQLHIAIDAVRLQQDKCPAEHKLLLSSEVSELKELLTHSGQNSAASVEQLRA